MEFLDKECLDYERAQGYPCAGIVGVDEVGRGCLAGPVVAAAFLMPPEIKIETNLWLSKITDSKKLTPKMRDELYEKILQYSVTGIGQASVSEIDEINIFHASHLAMKRAIDEVRKKTEIKVLLVDGKFLPKNVPEKMIPIIKGDLKSLSISCASIVAKVWRDRALVELDQKYPGYGLALHKGYPTPVHKSALKKLGVTIEHRKSFAPVREALLER